MPTLPGHYMDTRTLSKVTFGRDYRATSRKSKPPLYTNEFSGYFGFFVGVLYGSMCVVSTRDPRST